MEKNEILEKIALANEKIKEALNLIQTQKEIVQSLKKELDNENNDIDRATISETKFGNDDRPSLGSVGENTINLGNDRPNNTNFETFDDRSRRTLHNVEQSTQGRRSEFGEATDSDGFYNEENNRKEIRETNGRNRSENLQRLIKNSFEYANDILKGKIKNNETLFPEISESEIISYTTPKEIKQIEKQNKKSKYISKSLFDFIDDETEQENQNLEQNVKSDINKAFVSAINIEVLKDKEVIDKVAEFFDKNDKEVKKSATQKIIEAFNKMAKEKLGGDIDLSKIGFSIDKKEIQNNQNTQQIKETTAKKAVELIDLLEIDEFPNDKDFNPKLIKTIDNYDEFKAVLGKYDLKENSSISKLKRKVDKAKLMQFEKNLDFAFENNVFSNVLHLPKSKNNFKKALKEYYESVAYKDQTIESLREYARIPNTEFRKALLSTKKDKFSAVDNWDNRLEAIFLITHGAIKEDEYGSAEIWHYESNIGGVSFCKAYHPAVQPQSLDSIDLEQIYNKDKKEKVLEIKTPQIVEKMENMIKPIVAVDYKRDDDIQYGGKEIRAKNNIQAIKLMQELIKSKKIPTLQEQEILSKYSGFGGLSGFLADDDNIAEIKNILGYNEENADKTRINQIVSNLKLSSLNAYYTPKIVIDAIYQGLDRLGLNSDEYNKKILEPSCGSGNFLTYCNNEKYQFVGVELDPITANIAKLLHPKQTIINKSYGDVEFETNFDAVIGNPPYGNELRIYDSQSKGYGASLHNYFNIKSLEMLKDKGIMAFVTTSYVLDSKGDKTRKLMSEMGTFLGAFRLPNNTFNTASVTTDIIFMQKTDTPNNKDFLAFENVVPFDENNEEIFINEYFKNNPQNILGDLVIEKNQFGEEVFVCKENKELNLEKALEMAIKTLPSNVYEWSETKRLMPEKSIALKELQHPNLINNDLLKKGNLIISDNTIYQIRAFTYDKNMVYADFVMDNNDKQYNRYVDFINLRDTLKSLYESEKNEKSDDEFLNTQREKLNAEYDKFVKKYKFLHSRSNNFLFDVKRNDQDIEANLILNLEKGIENSKKEIEYVKADIFSKRIIVPQPRLEISTPKDAYLATLSKFGYLNTSYLEEIAPNNDYKNTIQSLLDEGLIYENHKDEGLYIESHKYLSGNVKQKYAEVKNLVENGKTNLQKNLQDLEKAFPSYIKSSDINVNLGVSWINRKYYIEFIAQELLEINNEYDKKNFEESLFLKKQDNGKWVIEYDYEKFYSLNKYIHKFNQEYGINGINRARKTSISGFELLKDIFNNKKIEIKEKDTNNEKREVVNQELTMFANEKADSIKEKFNDWIFADLERRLDLEKVYNNTINVFAETKYNGDFLQLNNFNNEISLRPHQKDAIWRGISQKSMLLDHQVGAGKTLTTIAMIMQQKQMGLINKPLIVVPNHLTKQWESEFLRAYPNANILVADSDSMSKKYRLNFMTKIMNNEYDAIIMKHSQLNNIMPDIASAENILNKEVENIENMLRYLQEQEKNNKFKSKGKTDWDKKIEVAKKKVETKLNEMLKGFDIDKEIEFSRLGIDCLVLDEAHEYKNLFFTSTMGNVRGLGKQDGSIKALKLYAHTEFLHNNDKKVYFLTGTPVSNSIAEFYTMQRYIQPNILQETGLETFDDWARNYGKIEYTYQLNASGVNFELVPSFTKFINVAELMNMYKTNADIITNKDIEKFMPNFVPKLENNKPYNVITPRSENQTKYIEQIIIRLENLWDDPKHNNVLCCTTDARKCGIDYRMIDIEADDFENSKINALVENLYKEWETTKNIKGTQLVFCDLSTPKQNSQKINVDEAEEKTKNNDIDFFEDYNDKELDDDDKKANAINLDKMVAKSVKFDAYKDILKKLVKKGIPQNEIAFIHDCGKDDKKKLELFDKVNNGDVRILLGSTFTMGAGTNVQKRITALHHLDAPWRPSDLEQRVGRVIRQGNMFFESDSNFRVKEFRYATEKTYDSRMWQILETKSKSMEQLKIANAREFEEIAMESTNSAEMKAESSGNPFILKKFQLDTELKKEETLYKKYLKEVRNIEEEIKFNENKIKNLKENSEILSEFKDIWKNNSSDITRIKIKDSEFTILKNPNSDEAQLNTKTKESARNLFTALRKEIQYAYKDDFEPIFEYNGLLVSAMYASIDKKPGMVFQISKKDDDKISWEPENMRYTFDDAISLDSCLIKINNFMKSLDKRLENYKTDIEMYELSSQKLQQKDQNTDYKNLDYLKALRSDSNRLIQELDRISKEPNYICEWIPQSDKIKGDTEFVEVLAKFNEKRKENLEKTDDKAEIVEVQPNDNAEIQNTIQKENSQYQKTQKCNSSVAEILGEIDEFYLPKEAKDEVIVGNSPINMQNSSQTTEINNNETNDIMTNTEPPQTILLNTGEVNLSKNISDNR